MRISHLRFRVMLWDASHNRHGLEWILWIVVRSCVFKICCLSPGGWPLQITDIIEVVLCNVVGYTTKVLDCCKCFWINGVQVETDNESKLDRQNPKSQWIHAGKMLLGCNARGRSLKPRTLSAAIFAWHWSFLSIVLFLWLVSYSRKREVNKPSREMLRRTLAHLRLLGMSGHSSWCGEMKVATSCYLHWRGPLLEIGLEARELLW